MAHKRTDFTSAQKAAIFVRDHATCAFSGKSLSGSWITARHRSRRWTGSTTSNRARARARPL